MNHCYFIQPVPSQSNTCTSNRFCILPHLKGMKNISQVRASASRLRKSGIALEPLPKQTQLQPETGLKICPLHCNACHKVAAKIFNLFSKAPHQKQQQYLQLRGWHDYFLLLGRKHKAAEKKHLLVSFSLFSPAGYCEVKQ